MFMAIEATPDQQPVDVPAWSGCRVSDRTLGGEFCDSWVEPSQLPHLKTTIFLVFMGLILGR